MSRFVSDSFATNHVVMSFNNSYRASIHFSTLDDVTYYEGGVPTTVTLFNKATDTLISIELTKDQITHFLSLDCPDAFIAYALTLCPCPPETSEHIPYTDKAEVGGGILVRHALLKESVPVCECGSTFYRDDLGSCYDCFFPSDDRGE